ncbi:hypothetical protein CKA32_006526 [Geitlerinema sp. FC II]|nr:hypothetical protein [Geitlerinema sp. CS-897]PPT10083.1 hypothetical protein CKA32_006526 [Geitlerinema sp. FC II]
MNPYDIFQNTQRQRVSNRTTQPILKNGETAPRTLVLVWPQLGDFDSQKSTNCRIQVEIFLKPYPRQALNDCDRTFHSESDRRGISCCWVSRSLHPWTAALPKPNLPQTHIFTKVRCTRIDPQAIANSRSGVLKHLANCDFSLVLYFKACRTSLQSEFRCEIA